MDMGKAENFAQNLAALLVGHGSKVEIARRAGITVTGLNYIVRYGRIPSLETAIKLADAVKLPLTELLIPHDRFLKKHTKEDGAETAESKR